MGVVQENPAGVGPRLPIAIPGIDQFGARHIAGIGSVDMPRLGITPDRLAGASRGKLARRIALPFFMLAADRGALDRAVALSGGTDRGARLDRCTLLGTPAPTGLGTRKNGRKGKRRV